MLTSLEKLSVKGLVCKIAVSGKQERPTYTPALPPESVSLAGFFEKWGFNPNDKPEILAHAEPAVAAALGSLAEYADSAAASKSVKEIL